MRLGVQKPPGSEPREQYVGSQLWTRALNFSFRLMLTVGKKKIHGQKNIFANVLQIRAHRPRASPSTGKAD